MLSRRIWYDYSICLKVIFMATFYFYARKILKIYLTLTQILNHLNKSDFMGLLQA